MRWQQVQEYVTAPPARPAAPGQPRSTVRPARMTAEQEAAAFAAFAAETGA